MDNDADLAARLQAEEYGLYLSSGVTNRDEVIICDDDENRPLQSSSSSSSSSASGQPRIPAPINPAVGGSGKPPAPSQSQPGGALRGIHTLSSTGVVPPSQLGGGSGFASSSSSSSSSSTRELNLADRTLEQIDPHPDIRALAGQFNTMFFQGLLSAVEVRWSNKMTLCAGLCLYERHGRYCSVRLSEPLLKFRPRSDTINTLLHELIHAYLFVTERNTDRSGHGPNFLALAKRINDAAGTDITVYHTFHDEVDKYRVHVWKCSGPCTGRSPYFGLVKRAMNRAPGPSDYWWAEHKAACGGTYTKIAGPPPKEKGGKARKAKGGAEAAGESSGAGSSSSSSSSSGSSSGGGYVLGGGAGSSSSDSGSGGRQLQISSTTGGLIKPPAALPPSSSSSASTGAAVPPPAHPSSSSVGGGRGSQPPSNVQSKAPRLDSYFPTIIDDDDIDQLGRDKRGDGATKPRRKQVGDAASADDDDIIVIDESSQGSTAPSKSKQPPMGTEKNFAQPSGSPHASSSAASSSSSSFASEVATVAVSSAAADRRRLMAEAALQRQQQQQQQHRVSPALGVHKPASSAPDATQLSSTAAPSASGGSPRRTHPAAAGATSHAGTKRPLSILVSDDEEDESVEAGRSSHSASARSVASPDNESAVWRAQAGGNQLLVLQHEDNDDEAGALIDNNHDSISHNPDQSSDVAASHAPQTGATLPLCSDSDDVDTAAGSDTEPEVVEGRAFDTLAVAQELDDDDDDGVFVSQVIHHGNASASEAAEG